MSEKLRIKEAVQIALKTGKAKTKLEISGKIFTYCSQDSARIRLNKYENGNSLRIDRETVERICRVTGVTPNFIFGWPESELSNLNIGNDENESSQSS